jgi:TLD
MSHFLNHTSSTNRRYAEEFGFDFNDTDSSIKATLANEDDDCTAHVFKILGTSASDASSQPHVLSPPVMDSLLSFVPDSLSMENYWMKFSLIRDGASLYTLKQYVKAAPYTLLAIETTKGQVFGAFTSHTWRNHPTFYGSAPAFLWRMRHNRRTPCHSLYEQAQLESEIDVYAYSDLNDLVQVCDDYRLAVGGGRLVPDSELCDPLLDPSDADGIMLENLDAGQNFGFGIALDENLRGGTTSPCGTFRNPCLIDHMSKGEVFECANVEVWTFTPCADVKSAERMEMTRYFVEESIREVSSCQSSPKAGSIHDIYCNPFNTQEEFQKDFYRRVGYNTPSNDQIGAFQFGSRPSAAVAVKRNR